MLPTSVLRLGTERSSIKVLPVKLHTTPWPIGIVMLKDRTISPIARLFIDCVRETAKPLVKGK